MHSARKKQCKIRLSRNRESSSLKELISGLEKCLYKFNFCKHNLDVDNCLQYIYIQYKQFINDQVDRHWLAKILKILTLFFYFGRAVPIYILVEIS